MVNSMDLHSLVSLEPTYLKGLLFPYEPDHLILPTPDWYIFEDLEGGTVAYRGEGLRRGETSMRYNGTKSAFYFLQGN